MAAPGRVLVTGGNKGIGKALCRQLAVDHGYHVLLGSRDASRGQAAVDEIVASAPEVKDRVELVELDVAQDASVAKAAEAVASKYGKEGALKGIINNAGMGFGQSLPDTFGVNFWGPKRVCDAFIPLLCQKSGRVVNTSSASGPMFVQKVGGEMGKVLTDPAVTFDQIEAIVQQGMENSELEGDAYGFSKACLNAYTMVLARAHPHLAINGMTPGFIDTDITAGMGASKTPEEGTKVALHCLMGKLEGNGRYYGSDAVRSPLDRYRGPGDPPYEGP